MDNLLNLSSTKEKNVLEPNEKFHDYLYICDILLKRYELAAEKFRVLFRPHKKRPEMTWKYVFFEIRIYLKS